MDTSKADTGSSHIISFGLTSNALAIAALWHCPPLTSAGYLFFMVKSRPTLKSILSISFSASSLFFAILVVNKGIVKISIIS